MLSCDIARPVSRAEPGRIPSSAPVVGGNAQVSALESDTVAFWVLVP
jgi:hypothetical protein